MRNDGLRKPPSSKIIASTSDQSPVRVYPPRDDNKLWNSDSGRITEELKKISFSGSADSSPQSSSPPPSSPPPSSPFLSPARERSDCTNDQSIVQREISVESGLAEKKVKGKSWLLRKAPPRAHTEPSLHNRKVISRSERFIKSGSSVTLCSVQQDKEISKGTSPRTFFKNKQKIFRDNITEENVIAARFNDIVDCLMLAPYYLGSSGSSVIVDIEITKPGCEALFGWENGKFEYWSKDSFGFSQEIFLEIELNAFCLLHDKTTICVGTKNKMLQWYDLSKDPVCCLHEYSCDENEWAGDICSLETGGMAASGRRRKEGEDIVCARKQIGSQLFSRGKVFKELLTQTERRLLLSICSAITPNDYYLAYAMAPKSFYESISPESLNAYSDGNSEPHFNKKHSSRDRVQAMSGSIFTPHIKIGSDEVGFRGHKEKITSLSFCVVDDRQMLLVGDESGAIVLIDFIGTWESRILLSEACGLSAIKKIVVTADGRFAFFVAKNRHDEQVALYMLDIKLSCFYPVFSSNEDITALSCTNDANSYYILYGLKSGIGCCRRIYKPYNFSVPQLVLIAYGNEDLALEWNAEWSQLPEAVRNNILSRELLRV